jgi:2-dehydropantoate 2-reductase
MNIDVEEKKYLIVGSGRLSHHLKFYFSSVGISYLSWSRKDNYSLEGKLLSADIVLLAISDCAIENFILENKSHFKDKTLVHFSGALATDYAVGCHPLMTFTESLYDSSFYQKILFTLDDDGPEFNEIFPLLKNPNIRISKRMKGKYHALCVMANNYTCLLWQKFFDELTNEFGAESKDLEPFLFQTFKNITADYKSCLTGPLSRNDTTTITKNLSSLDGDAYKQVYKSFVDMYNEEKVK